MALSIVGANSSGTTSVTIPSHSVGELIVIWAYSGSSATLPTVPSAAGTVPAWTTIDANTGANVNSSRSAYYVSTTGSETSGTWTGATNMIAVVLNGQASSPIGGHAESGSTAVGSATAPSITMTNTSGSSVLLEFFGCMASTAFTSWSSAPSGYAQQTEQIISGGGPGVCLDTKNSTTSDGSVTQSNSATVTKGYRGDTIEILAAATGGSPTNLFFF